MGWDLVSGASPLATRVRSSRLWQFVSGASPQLAAAAAAETRLQVARHADKPHCSVTLIQKTSTANCTLGTSFGCNVDEDTGHNSVWVSGCRGIFQCGGEKKTVHCGYPPGRPHYSCSCDAHDDWYMARTQRLVNPKCSTAQAVNPKCSTAACKSKVQHEERRFDLSRRLLASATDDVGAVHLKPQCELRPQRIPRTIRQTARPPLGQLRGGMARGPFSWYDANLDYEYVYYDDAALAEYVQRHAHHVPGFASAYRLARTGAERVDLWRGLVIWMEGGIYVDIGQIRSDRATLPAASTTPIFLLRASAALKQRSRVRSLLRQTRAARRRSTPSSAPATMRSRGLATESTVRSSSCSRTHRATPS